LLFGSRLDLQVEQRLVTPQAVVAFAATAFSFASLLASEHLPKKLTV
jgi:hypothetical protein